MQIPNAKFWRLPLLLTVELFSPYFSFNHNYSLVNTYLLKNFDAHSAPMFGSIASYLTMPCNPSLALPWLGEARRASMHECGERCYIQTLSDMC